MKAVGYRRVPEPTPRPHGLVVDIKAISVNPVDTKVRQSTEPPDGEPTILGWEASGVVRAVGPDVTLFRPATSTTRSTIASRSVRSRAESAYRPSHTSQALRKPKSTSRRSSTRSPEMIEQHRLLNRVSEHTR